MKEEKEEEEEGKESILVFRSPRGSFFQSEWLRYALKNGRWYGGSSPLVAFSLSTHRVLACVPFSDKNQ